MLVKKRREKASRGSRFIVKFRLGFLNTIDQKELCDTWRLVTGAPRDVHTTSTVYSFSKLRAERHECVINVSSSESESELGSVEGYDMVEIQDTAARTQPRTKDRQDHSSLTPTESDSDGLEMLDCLIA